MLDPPETASNIAKAAKELGWDPIVTTIVMAAGSIVSLFAWFIGDRGRKKVGGSETDIAIALLEHERQKAFAQMGEDISTAVTQLKDIVRILSQLDRGQRELIVTLEQMFTALELNPARPRRHRDDAG
jgi:hypothetical protein